MCLKKIVENPPEPTTNTDRSIASIQKERLMARGWYVFICID